MSKRLVHSDGGQCHGTVLDDGWCRECGTAPDAQSTELWSQSRIDAAYVERALAFVGKNGYAMPTQCEALVDEIRKLRGALAETLHMLEGIPILCRAPDSCPCNDERTHVRIAELREMSLGGKHGWER